MSAKRIIGRAKEIKILDSVWRSREAEFIAIYGRRRVGKTHLIRKYFSDKGIFLETSGEKDQQLQKQLENFMGVLSKTFFKGAPLLIPRSWGKAFDFFTKELERVAKTKKVILFFDELPWMATKKSGLLQAIDYYWNLHWSRFPNFILVACGSAASWMLEKLIYAKGGLHKRITKKILLEPYNLKDTKEFLEKNGVRLNHKQVLDIYMAIGGIPFYLKAVVKGLSAAQNIDAICFQKNGLLYNEFTNLFQSLFEHVDVSLAIVKEIMKHGNEISREELILATKIKSGGTLNKRLQELEAFGFIQGFLPYGRKQRDRFYRIVDEFSLFYLQWIEPVLDSGLNVEKGYWKNMAKTPAVSTWAGYAFENICLKHISQISIALDIENIPYTVGSWRYIPKIGVQNDGAQIDLLFDRQDGVVTLCEIKYSNKPFSIDKTYGKQLIRKMTVFKQQLRMKKQIFLAMLTTMGLKSTNWSNDLVQNEVTMEDLFR